MHFTVNEVAELVAENRRVRFAALVPKGRPLTIEQTKRIRANAHRLADQQTKAQVNRIDPDAWRAYRTATTRAAAAAAASAKKDVGGEFGDKPRGRQRVDNQRERYERSAEYVRAQMLGERLD